MWRQGKPLWGASQMLYGKRLKSGRVDCGKSTTSLSQEQRLNCEDRKWALNMVYVEKTVWLLPVCVGYWLSRTRSHLKGLLMEKTWRWRGRKQNRRPRFEVATRRPRSSLGDWCSEKKTSGESARDSAPAERRVDRNVWRDGNSSSHRGQAISRPHLRNRCEGNNAQQNTKWVMQDKNRFKPEYRAAGTSSVKVQDWTKYICF